VVCVINNNNTLISIHLYTDPNSVYQQMKHSMEQQHFHEKQGTCYGTFPPNLPILIGSSL